MLKLLTTITAITILLISAAPTVYGQHVKSLGYSHAIVQAAHKTNKSFHKNTIDSIYFTDEFFEDFSDYHYTHYPRSNRWADSYVFINSTYAEAMISTGVATLDAYNQKGYPYYSVNNKVVPSDTLTSQPFYFNEAPNTNPMFFSFFYQPGGKGDIPQGASSEAKTDTLILEFYAPSVSQWVRAYATLNDTTPSQFTQEVIEVPDSLMVNGFRFRFRNYSSYPDRIQQGTDAGQFSNADMWHIDYIQMRRAGFSSELTDLADLTIAQPLRPFLKEYVRVPWHHYAMALQVIESLKTPLNIKTNFSSLSDPFTVTRRFTSYNNYNGQLINSIQSENFMLPVDEAYWEQIFPTGLNYSNTDYGSVEVVVSVSCDEPQRTSNDTVKRREFYYDHYSYDDGTAEAGFGLDGNDDISRIAVRFRAFRREDNPDLLHAVLIYFAKSADSATFDYEYKISIRKNNGAVPSNEVLYESVETYTPDYSTWNNEFTRIEIDPPVEIFDTFFVVIEQITGFLNIGYDYNNNTLDKIFHYSFQQWSSLSGSKKIPQGSLMIRPSFKADSRFLERKEELAQQTARVYPNPVSDELFINFDRASGDLMHIQIFNATGMLMYSAFTDERSVQVSDYEPGLYFMRITNQSKSYQQTVKFIKD